MGKKGHRLGAMEWLRAHRRAGAAVALLAMALQFAGLFGHVHLRDGSATALSLEPHLVAAGGELHHASDHATLPMPDGDALCAICLAGHLASAAVAASPPVLFAPVAHQPRAPPAFDAVRVAKLERAFWSQGPPAV